MDEDQLPPEVVADDETLAAAGAGAGEPPLLTNGQLAQIFHDIGDLLEVKGELVFKTVAYHRAADAIGRFPVDVTRAYRDGAPPDIPASGRPFPTSSPSWRPRAGSPTTRSCSPSSRRPCSSCCGCRASARRPCA